MDILHALYKYVLKNCTKLMFFQFITQNRSHVIFAT